MEWVWFKLVFLLFFDARAGDSKSEGRDPGKWRVSMSSGSSGSDVIDSIVVKYLERKQRGESPTIEEYCKEHPGLAAEIRSLLQTVDLSLIHI